MPIYQINSEFYTFAMYDDTSTGTKTTKIKKDKYKSEVLPQKRIFFVFGQPPKENIFKKRQYIVEETK